MRTPLLFLAGLLASCATAPSAPPPDPATLFTHADLLRREEGAARLSIQKRTVQEALDERQLAAADADTAALVERLELAAEEKTPELMVRRAWHALRCGALAREWKRLSAALSRQGLQLEEMYEPHEAAKFVRFVAKRSAYINDAGDRHNLFFWVQSVQRDDGVWVVREIYAGLHAAFNARFKSIAARDRYARGSVLAQFFSLQEVPRVAAVFPILEELALLYGRIRIKDEESAPAGFHVHAGFVMEAKAGGRSIYYTSECGLDPRERRGGILMWDEFTPSESLGPLTPRGSGIWGAGGLRPTDD